MVAELRERIAADTAGSGGTLPRERSSRGRAISRR